MNLNDAKATVHQMRSEGWKGATVTPEDPHMTPDTNTEGIDPEDGVKKPYSGTLYAPATKPVMVDIPHLQPEDTAAVGATITVTMGNWEGEPDTYTYTWRKDGIDMPGFATKDYIVGMTDAGHTINCVVTASNEAGTTDATPSNSVTVPADTAGGLAARSSKRGGPSDGPSVGQPQQPRVGG